jgi:hypothetical protein
MKKLLLLAMVGCTGLFIGCGGDYDQALKSNPQPPSEAELFKTMTNTVYCAAVMMAAPSWNRGLQGVQISGELTGDADPVDFTKSLEELKVFMERDKAKLDKLIAQADHQAAEYIELLEEWYKSLLVCLHCGSDLKVKGAKTCAQCGKDQRDLVMSKYHDPKGEVTADYRVVPSTNSVAAFWRGISKGYKR